MMVNELTEKVIGAALEVHLSGMAFAGSYGD
jgi:hypothetical protein